MHNTNVLYGVTGHVAEFPAPDKAIIRFELDGVLQSAFLKYHRFYKDGKRLTDNINLNKFLKVGHKVNFSCHISDYSEPGQCKWFIINCWNHIESEHKLIMSSGMMNVAGIVTDLKQRHGTLLMIDLLGNEHKVHFLASKVYLFGKRLAASKPLTSQLQIDDKVFFDAIPCFPEENNQDCNWFATSVHNGKKPEMILYKDSSETETLEKYRERMYDIDTLKLHSPADHIDLSIDGIDKDIQSLSLNARQSVIDYDPTANVFENVVKQSKTSGEEKQTSEVPIIGETDLFKEEFNLKIEPSPFNAQMLQDIKLLTNDPREVFAKSEGIILDIINEEYGVILGEFQRNVFRSILFHRSNAFLFKMSLAHSKLSEIFIEGDRVRFIAVNAPKKFICDWIATQVSVAPEEQEELDESDDDDLSDDFID